MDNEAEIGAGEAVCCFGDDGEVDVGGDGGAAELGLEDLQAGVFVGEGDVDELIETTRSQKRRVDLIGSAS